MKASGDSRYNRCSGLNVSLGSARDEADAPGDSDRGGTLKPGDAGDASGLRGYPGAAGERGKMVVLMSVASEEKKVGGKAE